MDSNKVIFIDVDGPLIPVRAYHLLEQPQHVCVFDPCAVGLINKLIELSGAKIVISSTWRKDGYLECCALFAKNGIDINHFHDDWATPQHRMSDTRTTEILHWLELHPEVTTYVAIDDELLSSDTLPNAVQCCAYEGFSWRNYIECKLYLKIVNDGDNLEEKLDKYRSEIAYFKAKEVRRVLREFERGPTGLINQLCDALLHNNEETP